MSSIPFIMSFMLIRLLRNPACMRRVQRELDDVVGGSRPVTLDDRVRLPYLEAALRETMRLDTLTPNNVPHRAMRATKIAQYDVPEGCVVITVNQHLHESAELFSEPLAFRPERFLGANGALNVQLDKTIPFSAGKRMCPAETYSRNIMFLFMATVLQNFEVSVPPGETLEDPRMECQPNGLTKSPIDFRLKFTSR